ncbi:hypothetical protein CON64_08650 [Bacillus pseudomycoides]|nr:hypothetical protein CON64_08650 [Bacillus pseudomycoides]
MILYVYELKNDIKSFFHFRGDESIWPSIETVRAFSYHVQVLKQKGLFGYREQTLTFAKEHQKVIRL